MKRILMKMKKFKAERDKEIQLHPAVMDEFIDPDLSCLTGHKTGMAGHFLFLFNIAREINAQHIVEIGFGGANSAMAFMLALKETGGHLTSIDINPSPVGIHKIKAMELMSQFHLIRCASQDIWGQVQPEIDILLIDGKHSYNQCKLDYKLYEPLVKTDGFILFHDSATIKGIIQFTTELKKRVNECLQLPYSNGLFVIRKTW